MRPFNRTNKPVVRLALLLCLIVLGALLKWEDHDRPFLGSGPVNAALRMHDADGRDSPESDIAVRNPNGRKARRSGHPRRVVVARYVRFARSFDVVKPLRRPVSA